MNPYDEQAMMLEVIYLHSLWHQGPPNRNSNPNPIHFPYPNLNSRPRLNHDPSRNLHVTNHGHFKNSSRPRRQNAGNNHHDYLHNHPQQQLPGPDPGPEWPVNAPPTPQSTSGWPQKEPNSGQTTRSISAEEQAKISAMKMQLEVFQTCRDFFAKRVGQDSDEDHENGGFDEGDEDYLLEKEGIEESEEYKLFLIIFVEKSELRGYYESNHDSGEFCCLVCGGVGERIGRKFKGCLGLVQHSTWISKTKKRRAHRAFAKVVCKVLAWDMDKLPVIVLKGEPLSRSLGNLKEIQGSLVLNGLP